MKVTVCELPEASKDRLAAFDALIQHVRKEGTEFLLLPEMPFDAWLSRTQEVTLERWQEAVDTHESMVPRFAEMGATVIAGTAPIIRDGKPYNEGFVWDSENGYRGAHLKYYLPEEEEFWEASWYRRGPKQFDAIDTKAGKLGFLICTEMWFTEWARHYGRQDIQLILSPRAAAGSVDRWVTGGRAAAIMSGAFSLSSNRAGLDEHGIQWPGAAWIISPEGEILGTTSAERPFLTLDLDLEEASAAKSTYPRYVLE